jgi:hypothetical protein
MYEKSYKWYFWNLVGIVGIYGPWATYLIIQINSKSPLMEEEFSPTWEVEGNAPQLKRGTLLHVRRKNKGGGRARDINKSHACACVFSRVRVYICITCDL